MTYLTQKTLKKSINFQGIGLHTGKKSRLTIKPTFPNSGIIFKRIDIKNNNIILPNFMSVSSTSLNTTIQNDFGIKVSTIEHLMGALAGLGVDNALIEIDNEEVPILDGSAKVFVDKIASSGFEISNTPIKIVKILKKVEYKDKDRFIKIEPSSLNLIIDFELKYKNPLIGNQRNIIKVYDDNLTDIFNSRTYCLYEDIEKIKTIGLAKGGSLENAVVVKDNEILNKEGLRNKKEFVNHKILDCIGDFYTCGFRLIGKVICSQGGHFLTNQLLRKIFYDKSNFAIVEIKEKSLPHSVINRKILRSIA